MIQFPLVTLDGHTVEIENGELDEFAAGLRGPLLGPRSPGYHEARALWNGLFDRYPGLIVECLGAADVVRSVKFAAKHDLLTAVRGGGHNVAGHAACDGGLMISLRRMDSVRVDPRARRAWVGPGATIGDFDLEAQAFGLATPLGVHSTTGVSGLTLGGGFGWMSRKYGLTLDNLVAADVVTASGDYLRVSEDDNPDLFWGIRGGGGNFGIITDFQFQLHPIGPEVFAGLIVHPFSEAREALGFYRDFTRDAPDELTVWVVIRKAPPLPFLPNEIYGKEVLIFACLYTGDPSDGEEALRPFRAFGNPLADGVRRHQYTVFQQAFDPFLLGGQRNYWQSHDFLELSDGLLDSLIPLAANLPNHSSEILIAQVGGAMGRIPEGATAYSGREANFVMNLLGRWHEERDDYRFIGWARELYEATEPFATGGVYLNFLSGDEWTRVLAAFGGQYSRLAELKRKYDPSNFFRINHNVTPGGIP